jgi:hypothetical protein
MTHVEPTDEDRAAVSAGALTVAGAVEFSGISERTLFRHMAAGELDWFPMGAKGTRFIPRAALIELMATYRAQHRARTN